MTYSCLSERSTLTAKEEHQLVAWLLAAAKSRPQDWEWTGYNMTDQKTGMSLWLANGPGFLHLSPPYEVYAMRTRFVFSHKHPTLTDKARIRIFPFPHLSRRPRNNADVVFDAFHDLRHEVESRDFKELKELMDKAQPTTQAVEKIKKDIAPAALMSPKFPLTTT